MSAHSVYKLWISLQCQMIAGCTQGLLVKKSSTASFRVVARWPDHTPLNNALSKVAKTSGEQEKIYMQKDPDQGVYFAHPVKIENKPWGVIVLHLNDRSPKVMQATIRLLKWGFTWLQVMHSALINNESDDSNEDLNANLVRYQKLVEFISHINRATDLDTMSIIAVNHLAKQFKFDRVSLGLLKQNNLQLRAISFVSQFDKRSDLIEQLSHTLQEAIEQNTDILIPAVGPTKHLQVQHKVLVKQQQLAYCATLLIKEGDLILGGLLLEKKQGATPPVPQMHSIKQYVNAIGESVAIRSGITQPQKSSDKILNLMRFLTKRKQLERLFIIFFALIAVLSLLPYPYTLQGDATIQSKSRHLLVAPFDGFLSDVLVEPGQKVEAGEVLAKLKDDDLILERDKLVSQIQQLNLEYDTALAAADRAQAAIVDSQISQSRVQLELAQKMMSRTVLVAPASGVIVSDDIRQSIGAPVQQGDILIEVAKSNNFDVQVFILENDIAEIKPTQSGKLSLFSFPGETFEIKVKKITPISEISNGNNYFRVEAELTENVEALRPGMRGSGKISIGSRRLGWIWFHDFWYWIRRNLWL